MSINNTNIRNFIAYIYYNKYQTKPTDAILSSWTTLTDEEITLHLNQLYTSWGKTSDDLTQDISTFEAAITSHIEQKNIKPSTTVAQPTVDTSINISPQTPKPAPQSSKKWIWYIILPILGISGFIGFKFVGFQALKPLFVITDNVAVRDADGNSVGRMDIFPNNTSWNSLRAVDESIYEIPVNGKVSESRKLLLNDATFVDYLLNKKAKHVYVNKNFLTDNRDYINLNTSVFEQINQVKHENTALSSNYRKVIVGSISLENTLKDKYILNTCNNAQKDFTAIIKIQLKDKKRYTAVAKMSDGNYYKFTGNPDENTFERPQMLKVKHPDQDGFIDLYGKDLLFKTIEGNTYLFSCDKTQLDFKMIKNADGDLSHFQSTYIPS